jgi:hypothetical protein
MVETWDYTKTMCKYVDSITYCTLRSTSNDATIGSPKCGILSKPQVFTKRRMAITAYDCRK